MPEQTIRKRLSNYIAIAKVSKITPHGFRHSYVSLLISLGCSTKTVAELIGDTELQVIKTYSHIYKGNKKKAISMLNNLHLYQECTKEQKQCLKSD